jgi:phosphoribosylamine--glycine ligase
LPLVESRLTELFWAAADGTALPEIRISQSAAVTTVLAAEGYPDSPKKGALIDAGRGAQGARDLVFHAGTRRDASGSLRTNGGRVLAVTAVRESFADAQAASRALADSIEFEGKQFRRDIGWREAARVT